jgi:hypothetical protein
MTCNFWKGIQHFLLLGRADDELCLGPAEALVHAHRLISQLADQIDAHAARAPYPHVARQLGQIATEKRDAANWLRIRIENMGERPGPALADLKLAHNHWQELNLDLKDQIALEDFLLRQEPMMRGATGVAETLEKLRELQKPHRRILTTLIGFADPQANQS